jgi:hypothetical protein
VRGGARSVPERMAERVCGCRPRDSSQCGMPVSRGSGLRTFLNVLAPALPHCPAPKTFARVGGEVAEQAGALRSVGRWVHRHGQRAFVQEFKALSSCRRVVWILPAAVANICTCRGGGTELAGTLRSGGRWVRRHGRRAFIEALIKTSLCNRVGIT